MRSFGIVTAVALALGAAMFAPPPGAAAADATRAHTVKCSGGWSALEPKDFNWDGRPQPPADQRRYGALVFSAVAPRRLDLNFSFTKAGYDRLCFMTFEPFFLYSNGGEINYDYSTPLVATGAVARMGFRILPSRNSGHVYQMAFPPGSYELTMSVGSGLVGQSHRDMVIRFDIREGAATYIGEYDFLPLSAKVRFPRAYGGWKIVVTDRSERDLAVPGEIRVDGPPLLEVPPLDGRQDPLFDSKP